MISLRQSANSNYKHGKYLVWEELPTTMAKEVCTVVLQRWEVLDRLRKATADKRTLVEDVDCSRSTVNRAIRELESVDMVEHIDGEYEVTPLGETVASRFEEVMETIELRTQFKPFLHWVPEDEFDLELQHLRDAELLLPKPGDPYAMINQHVDIVSRTTDHNCVLPLIGLHALTAGHEQVVENGAHVELVVAPKAADALQFDSDYAELTEEMAATGRFRLYRYDGTIPYFVGLFDNTVQIGVDDDGEPRALVETDNPEVQEWAATTIQDYKRQAELVMGVSVKETQEMEV